MAQIRGSRWWMGLTAILAVLFLGLAALLTFRGWPSAVAPATGPSASGPTVAPTASGAPAGPGDPLQATPLTRELLDGIGPGWVLAEYDSSGGRFGPPLVAISPDPTAPTPAPSVSYIAAPGAAAWEDPGPRYLYVVDPSGALYSAGGFNAASGLAIAAWLPDHRTAIVSEPVAGGVALRSLDLIYGDLSDPFPGPAGRVGAPWRDPHVAVSRDGLALLIDSATAGGTRTIARVGLDGVPIAVPVGAAEIATFVESASGTTIVTLERIDTSEGKVWTIATYWAPGTSIFPSPSPSPSASPTPSAPVVPPPTPGEWERHGHGLPAGESDCVPASWPRDRQLVIECGEDDGGVILYTLAPLTSTFAAVATIPPLPGSSTFDFSADGTRIATGRVVINVSGDEVWSVPTSDPTPVHELWSGPYLLAWGREAASPTDSPLAPTLTALHSSHGDLIYRVAAHPGVAGFTIVLSAFGG